VNTPELTNNMRQSNVITSEIKIKTILLNNFVKSSNCGMDSLKMHKEKKTGWFLFWAETVCACS
jgi:hypothetical protein